jgi:XrtJ-associated TM-motif-TM protein
MKKLGWLAAVALVLVVAAPVYAQNGCVNSPENPTAVLALVGGASALLVTARNRMRRK